MGAPESVAAELRVGAARFARATARLEECAVFYREIVGLAQLFEFSDHAGYRGFVFGLPGRSAQLELVRLHGAPTPPPADPEHAVVLYLRGGFEALRTRLADHGVGEVVPDNPYWVAAGAFAVLDPEGWMLIVVPPGEGAGAVRIEEFTGDRAEIAWSFRMAEDSESLLAGYLGRGRVWVARNASGAVVGHIQAAADVDGSTWEIVNTAVVHTLRGTGVGRAMIDTVVAAATVAGARRLELATATADVGNLRFYQRCGFRMTRLVPDVFTAAAGYSDLVMVDGIRMLDQVWFAREL